MDGLRIAYSRAFGFASNIIFRHLFTGPMRDFLVRLRKRKASLAKASSVIDEAGGYGDSSFRAFFRVELNALEGLAFSAQEMAAIMIATFSTNLLKAGAIFPCRDRYQLV
jgi:hypothetical protein